MHDAGIASPMLRRQFEHALHGFDAGAPARLRLAASNAPICAENGPSSLGTAFAKSSDFK
jgi:hypothetical protein